MHSDYFLNKYVFAENLIVRAGELLEKILNKPLEINSKNDNALDIVSNADLLLNNFLISELKKKYPNDFIISEEKSDNKLNLHNTWVIDPIDGTNGLSRELPHYAIMIAYFCKVLKAPTFRKVTLYKLHGRQVI